jgi:hypothetical protein
MEAVRAILPGKISIFSNATLFPRISELEIKILIDYLHSSCIWCGEPHIEFFKGGVILSN